MPRKYTPRVTLTCAHCKQEFSLPPSRTKRRRFCSKACSYAAQVGAAHPSWREKTINLVCQHCGVTFTDKASRVANGRGKFCSRECRSKHSRASVTCRQCGAVFSALKVNIEKGKARFCSMPCARTYIKIRPTRVCPHCGRQFEPRVQDIRRGGGKYCSRPCYAAYLRSISKKDRHSYAYQEWRREVYQRDNYTCQDCGDTTGGNLHAHHIKRWAKHPELRFDVSNGVTLCKPCHQSKHRFSLDA